jgi:hypothetical protein
VQHLIPVADIEEIVLPECSQVLALIKSKGNKDLFIECFRRFELIRYLNQVLDYLRMKRFRVIQKTEYAISKQNRNET